MSTLLCWDQVIAILASILAVSPAMVTMRMRNHQHMGSSPRGLRTAAQEALQDGNTCLSLAAEPVMRSWCRRCRIYGCLTHPNGVMPR